MSDEDRPRSDAGRFDPLRETLAKLDERVESIQARREQIEPQQSIERASPAQIKMKEALEVGDTDKFAQAQVERFKELIKDDRWDSGDARNRLNREEQDMLKALEKAEALKPRTQQERAPSKEQEQEK
jgi:hypothetical protein